MADTRFHSRTEPKTLKQLATLAGAELGEGSDADKKVNDVASLSEAGDEQVSFLDNIRYKDEFINTKAGACIVAKEIVPLAPKGLNLLISPNPYKSYALIAQAFYPEKFPVSDISPQAHVTPDADIGEGCIIEAGAVVQAGASIGKGCWIESCAVVGRNVVMGDKCRIGANATVSHAKLGNAVRLYPGARVGQDGFGFAIDPAGHVKVPQLGRVIIEDHVEIGANTCIDRGAGPDTVIGAGTWIDNQVQIGHNVKIGRGCVLVAQSGVAGSSVLGDFVVVAAQAGIAGHLKIESGVRIGAQSGVMRDVSAGLEVLGAPAVPAKEFMRQVVALKRLTNSSKK